MTPELTENDLAWLRSCALARHQQDRDDDGGPECVMTSIGYVDLWPDGSVTSFGETIYFLDSLDENIPTL